MADPSRKELLARQKELQAVYPEVNRELLKIPGVLRVGIGVKEIAGESTGEIVFRVYVADKKSDLSTNQRVPKKIKGFKTDVVVEQPDTPEEDTSKYRPVKPGTQIEADGVGGFGTIGCIGTLTSDGSAILLSNHHVLYGTSGKDGTESGQPTYCKSCCCTCNDIAVNLHGIRSGHLDCAIAQMKPGIQADARIKEIGFITGIANALVTEAVKKRGRTTELTIGTVTDLRLDGTGLKILEVEVKKNNGNDRFSRPGDSGSALLNSANQIIGLHKSGNNGDDVIAGNFVSRSVGIQEVLDAMTAAGFPFTITTGVGGDESLAVSEEREASLQDAMWALELRVKETPVGREMWTAFQRHQKEVLRLVNENRAVTVVWHRSQGPTYLGAIGRSAKEPAFRIPDEIEGVRRCDAATRVLAALIAHGSNELVRDLQEHGRPLFEAFMAGNTVEEIILAYEASMVEKTH